MIADFSSVLAMIIGWSLLLLIPIEGVRFSREANFKAIEKSDRRSKFLFKKFYNIFMLFFDLFVQCFNFKVLLFLNNHIYTFFDTVAAANSRYYSRCRVVFARLSNEFFLVSCIVLN